MEPEEEEDDARDGEGSTFVTQMTSAIRSEHAKNRADDREWIGMPSRVTRSMLRGVPQSATKMGRCIECFLSDPLLSTEFPHRINVFYYRAFLHACVTQTSSKKMSEAPADPSTTTNVAPEVAAKEDITARILAETKEREEMEKRRADLAEQQLKESQAQAEARAREMEQLMAGMKRQREAEANKYEPSLARAADILKEKGHAGAETFVRHCKEQLASVDPGHAATGMAIASLCEVATRDEKRIKNMAEAEKELQAKNAELAKRQIEQQQEMDRLRGQVDAYKMQFEKDTAERLKVSPLMYQQNRLQPTAAAVPPVPVPEMVAVASSNAAPAVTAVKKEIDAAPLATAVASIDAGMPAATKPYNGFAAPTDVWACIFRGLDGSRV